MTAADVIQASGMDTDTFLEAFFGAGTASGGDAS